MRSHKSLFIILLCLLITQGESRRSCYFYLEGVSEEVTIEDCSDRYGDLVPVRCVTAFTEAGNSLLSRKQCMTAGQAVEFCQRFEHIEDLECRICDGDLCNSTSDKIALAWILVLTILSTLIM